MVLEILEKYEGDSDSEQDIEMLPPGSLPESSDQGVTTDSASMGTTLAGSQSNTNPSPSDDSEAVEGTMSEAVTLTIPPTPTDSEPDGSSDQEVEQHTRIPSEMVQGDADAAAGPPPSQANTSVPGNGSVNGSDVSDDLGSSSSRTSISDLSMSIGSEEESERCSCCISLGRCGVCRRDIRALNPDH